MSYEEQRRLRILENKKKMEALGLSTTADAVLASYEEQQLRSKKRRKVSISPSNRKDENISTNEVTRRSRRLRSVGSTESSTKNQEGALEKPTMKTEGTQNDKRFKRVVTVEVEDRTTIITPFTLLESKVTVLDLGAMPRQVKWAKNYWSSSGCKFHHAYPIGYQARKSVFGKEFEMLIEAGGAGPVFKVTQDPGFTSQTAGHKIFCGNSPTQPWTQVCIAHRTGQRISGPLFFGFSEELTLKALYLNVYNDAEREAAMSGKVVESSELSCEEKAAKRFEAIEGVGYSTARVLAQTHALGRRRHTSPTTLGKWICEDMDARKEILYQFLTMNEEMPANTRAWPVWKKTMAPKIVEQIIALALK